MDGTLILAAASAADLQRLVSQARDLLGLAAEGRRVSYCQERGLEVIRFAASADELARCREAARTGTFDGTSVLELQPGRVALHPAALSPSERDTLAAIAESS